MRVVLELCSVGVFFSTSEYFEDGQCLILLVCTRYTRHRKLEVFRDFLQTTSTTTHFFCK